MEDPNYLFRISTELFDEDWYVVKFLNDDSDPPPRVLRAIILRARKHPIILTIWEVLARRKVPVPLIDRIVQHSGAIFSGSLGTCCIDRIRSIERSKDVILSDLKVRKYRYNGIIFPCGYPCQKDVVFHSGIAGIDCFCGGYCEEARTRCYEMWAEYPEPIPEIYRGDWGDY